MIAWLQANWQTVAVAVLVVLELVSVFVPKASGTLQGLIKAITGLGIKDPGIGGL